MLSQTIGDVQLLAFTHRAIALGLHSDAATYRALCEAYTTLLSVQADDDLLLLARLFDTAVPPTAATLQATLEALVVAHS